MKKWLAPILLVAFVACSSGAAKKLIVSVNEAQDSAAKTYEVAKALETDASTRCRAALAAEGKALPARAEEIQPMCAAVGVPVPYDPIKLMQAAGPINALYDAVRVANNQRLADPNGDMAATTVTNLTTVFAAVIAELEAAGIAVSQPVKDALAALRSAEVKP